MTTLSKETLDRLEALGVAVEHFIFSYRKRYATSKGVNRGAPMREEVAALNSAFVEASPALIATARSGIAERVWVERLKETAISEQDLIREGYVRGFRAAVAQGKLSSGDHITDELHGSVAYYKRLSGEWRGIAAAMGYEPDAHNDVKPTSGWLLERVAKYRAEATLRQDQAKQEKN